MAAGRKKVIVRRFTPGLLVGYLPASGIVLHDPSPAHIDLLDLTGRVQPVTLTDVKHICFVRDFNLPDPFHPERLGRKTFQARPRTEGLWLRLGFRDEEILEGLAPLDISLADTLMEEGGVYLIPPDIRGNTQRIFVPRASLTSMQILAVVTSPSRRPATMPPAVKDEQPGLFATELLPGSRPQ